MSGVPDKSRQDLEWERLQQAVAERCRGPLRERLELVLAADLAEMTGFLAETAEAAALLRDGEPLPLGGVPEIGEQLDRLRRGGGLDGPALAGLMSVLEAGQRLSAFLREREERVPRLRQACPVDRGLHSVWQSLQAALEPDGEIKDGASPKLGKLRLEVRRLRDRIVKKLEEIIHQPGAQLQDSLYTVREGRYVLPVRRDAQPRLTGIVHGASSSGATVFVEPGALVELGNNLVLVESELESEQKRICAELSLLAAEHWVEIDSCRAALDRADLRGASAILGRDLGGCVPRASDEQRLQLVQARHPLLVLAGGGAVANDLKLGSGEALVLSGPNAGGKTVALKLLGLCALMARAGLPIAAEEGSACGFFDGVFTDVGDEQSTAANLSTFSAHITNLTGILAKADQGTLVLLDELAGGTDPQEGAALACALLGALLDRGAAVAVTTHYHPLKALAGSDRRVRNASFNIDPHSLAPTFSLAHDVPGPSSALFVAQRFGIPGAVVENASRLLPEQTRHRRPARGGARTPARRASLCSRRQGGRFRAGRGSGHGVPAGCLMTRHLLRRDERRAAGRGGAVPRHPADKRAGDSVHRQGVQSIVSGFTERKCDRLLLCHRSPPLVPLGLIEDRVRTGGWGIIRVRFVHTENTTAEIQIADLVDVDEREQRSASIIFQGSREAQVVHMSAPHDTVMVGREQPSDLRVNDPSVSRQHARFHWIEGRMTVEDLQSKNGTWVDGKRVPNAVLTSGQEVMLGNLRVVVAIAGEVGSERPTKPTYAADEEEVVIENPVMRALYEQVSRVASREIPVLILGETGTGKEHIARSLHARGSRSGGPFKAVNCGAIPRELAESALFGHEKGAFTGAVTRSAGLFRQAHGGILFLDEIGELPLGAQASLLRSVETRIVTPLGSSREVEADIRIVAATHCDLEVLLGEGTFRQDLYYRLSAFTMEVPPLRERRDEIGPMARLFARRACEQWGWPSRQLHPLAIETLEGYAWPGNIRQLRNVVERSVLLSSTEVLAPGDLPRFLLDPVNDTAESLSAIQPSNTIDDEAAGLSFKDRQRRWEVDLISQAMACTAGNRRAAARLLRMPHRTLAYKLRTYGLANKSWDG